MSPVCLKLVSPGLECVTLLPLKTEAGNNEISRQKTIKNHKSSVLVSAIYNGWAEITRTMIDDRKKYNVNKGKSTKKVIVDYFFLELTLFSRANNKIQLIGF